MSDFLGLFGDDKSQNTESENSQTTMESRERSQYKYPRYKTDGSLQLHKEELDIVKNNVDAGQVVISKDVVEEQKTVDVPVMHEEVVIKRTPIE